MGWLEHPKPTIQEGIANVESKHQSNKLLNHPKMKRLALIILVALFAVSCGTSTQKKTDEKANMVIENQKAFLKNLASLCGNSYGGWEAYVQEGRESWSHRKFVMHVTVCDDEKVYIPFHLDDDQSRTWMFIIEEAGLRFRHDHRHPDGTPEDQTLYGGYANNEGTPFAQYFPADEYTIETLSDEHDRQWNVILADDLSLLSYQLLYSGKVVFQADFDLTKPL